MKISKLTLACLTPSMHSQTCGYWYTVKSNGMAHTAFGMLYSLRRWLEERGLTLAEPVPEKHGTHAYIRIEGEYGQSLVGTQKRWEAIKPTHRSIGLQNGQYVDIKFTRDEYGLVVEHKLNPNCHWRKTYDREKCSDTRATFDCNMWQKGYFAVNSRILVSERFDDFDGEETPLRILDSPDMIVKFADSLKGSTKLADWDLEDFEEGYKPTWADLEEVPPSMHIIHTDEHDRTHVYTVRLLPFNLSDE